MSDEGLRQAQANFARLDLRKVQSIVKSLAGDRKRALAFVADPDSFMRKEAADASLPSTLHFHVEIDGEEKPPEGSPAPENQIVVTMRLKLPHDYRDDVLKAFAEVEPSPTPKPDPSPKPSPKPDPKPPKLNCPGCGECIKVDITF